MGSGFARGGDLARAVAPAFEGRKPATVACANGRAGLRSDFQRPSYAT